MEERVQATPTPGMTTLIVSPANPVLVEDILLLIVTFSLSPYIGEQLQI
jgi:hypothetical protein